MEPAPLSPAVQLTVDGLVFGLIMAGVGLSLVFGTTCLADFAHGDLITVGAVMGWVFNNLLELPFLIAILLIRPQGIMGRAERVG